MLTKKSYAHFCCLIFMITYKQLIMENPFEIIVEKLTAIEKRLEYIEDQLDKKPIKRKKLL